MREWEPSAKQINKFDRIIRLNTGMATTPCKTTKKLLGLELEHILPTDDQRLYSYDVRKEQTHE